MFRCRHSLIMYCLVEVAGPVLSLAMQRQIQKIEGEIGRVSQDMWGALISRSRPDFSAPQAPASVLNFGKITGSVQQELWVWLLGMETNIHRLCGI